MFSAFQKKTKLKSLLIFIAIIVAATEALWEGYVIYTLLGLPALIIAFSAFFILTYGITLLSLESLHQHTKDMFARLKKCSWPTYFFQCIVLAVLFSFSVILSIFTFRNTGLWASGFMLSSGYVSVIPYYILAASVVISGVVISILFWIDFSLVFLKIAAELSKVSENINMNFLRWLIEKIFIFTGLGIASYFIAQSFIYMLESGAVAFAQLFFKLDSKAQMVSTLHPYLHIVISVTLSIIILKSLWEIFDWLGTLCRGDKESIQNKFSVRGGMYGFAVLIRAVATGYAMQGIALKSRVFTPFYAGFIAKVLDDTASYSSEESKNEINFGLEGVILTVLALLIGAGVWCSVTVPLIHVLYMSFPVGLIFVVLATRCHCTQCIINETTAPRRNVELEGEPSVPITPNNQMNSSSLLSNERANHIK